MTRRVDQVEDVILAVLCPVGEPDGVRLDRDAALALEIHAVEDLRLHFPGWSAPVVSRNRSASVDLPWSICAMTEKLRMNR